MMSTKSNSPQVCAGLTAMAMTMTGFLDRLSHFLGNQGEPLASKRPMGGPAAVLVIDASQSMNSEDWPPSRLHAARAAAKAYIERLCQESPDARVALVQYSCGAKTVCGLTPVSSSAALYRKIDQITAESMTNITAGLRQASRILDAGRGTCQVVLLTDGVHNDGPSPTSVASKLRRKAILEIVGIGGTPEDVDEDLLRAMASARGDETKRYRFIGDQAGLVDHFENLAGRLARS